MMLHKRSVTGGVSIENSGSQKTDSRENGLFGEGFGDDESQEVGT